MDHLLHVLDRIEELFKGAYSSRGKGSEDRAKRV